MKSPRRHAAITGLGVGISVLAVLGAPGMVLAAAPKQADVET